MISDVLLLTAKLEIYTIKNLSHPCRVTLVSAKKNMHHQIRKVSRPSWAMPPPFSLSIPPQRQTKACWVIF